MQNTHSQTIAAQATPPGKGGVSIIRLSGPKALEIGEKLCGKTLKPRYAHYCSFYSDTKQIIDQGLGIYFPGPNSFTGEDIVEIQGHGGPILVDLLLKRLLQLGAVIARPGEFSERAFLNDKIDLTQAEAIADLIDSQSEQAAKNALNSLKGEFSKRVNQILKQLTELRVYTEASIDFADEQIDLLADSQLLKRLDNVLANLATLLAQANQGALLQEGMKLVIVGRPNAGKSSLLNRLAGQETAIVTPIAGTTRDLVKETLLIDGLPIQIVDTAGLCQSSDLVEQIGIERAIEQIKTADAALLVIDINKKDDTDQRNQYPELAQLFGANKVTQVYNKIDLSQEYPQVTNEASLPTVYLSSKDNLGFDLLKEQIKRMAGFKAAQGNFSARRRHLEALEQTQKSLNLAREQLCFEQIELMAEELRQAGQSLGEITGQITSDQLLGKIFSNFCIGK